MLDIKLLREDKEKVVENLQKRIGFDTTIVENVLEIDALWKEQKGSLDLLKSQKNKESKAIAQIKKEGGDIKGQLDKVKALSEEISLKEKEVKELLEKRDTQLKEIPNLLDDEVPVGADDGENKEIRTEGEKPEFSFEPRNHQELCEMNNWYDLETAAKHSGARFYYLKNELVLLQTALYNYVLTKLSSKGYTPFEVPPMLKKESAIRAIPLGDFEDTVYSLKDGDNELFLIGTSEHALAVLHADQILNHTQLPLRYAGLSPCFRREAGVTKDSKGIFRVHNFNKIEQFVYCKPEQSDEFLTEILDNAEEIFKELEIHYRIVDICSGDMGNFAARKFDLEAWIPSQNQYREMVSASNYRDYGARRMNTRYQSEENTTEFVHTLNSTAIALTRTIIALIETHQREDGSVKLPKVLQPYFGGKESLQF